MTNIRVEWTAMNAIAILGDDDEGLDTTLIEHVFDFALKDDERAWWDSFFCALLPTVEQFCENEEVPL